MCPIAPAAEVYSADVGNLLLVHGICLDGSSWDLTASALRDRGHRVEAVDLNRGSLAADTAAAQECVEVFNGPLVACGHSYGGMVITGLTLPAGSHLVYLCALVPSEGESASGLMQSRPAELEKIMGLNDAGDLVLQGEDLDQVLWADASAGQMEWGRTKLRSQALAPLLESASQFAWRTTPSTYVVCRQDRTMNPDLQRQLASRTTEVVEWDSSHAPMLAKADLLVALLDEMASR